MNERLKDLEIQCWEPRQYGPPWFNAEKFAGLILAQVDLMLSVQQEKSIEQSWNIDESFATVRADIDDYFEVENE